MAEENEQATQSEAGAQTAEPTNETTEAPVEDYKTKYEALQGEHQKTAEELTQSRETFDLVSHAIDWDKVQQGNAPQQSEGDGENTVTKEDLQRSENMVNGKLMQLDFRQKHPELREYEETLVSPAISRIRRQNPRMPVEKVLDKAADDVKKLLETERQKGIDEATKKKAAAAATGGMGSAGTTTVKENKEDSGGESYSEYMAARKAKSRKNRGLE